MKLTDDSNLEGVGNTSTRRESLQLWRLKVRNPDQSKIREAVETHGVCARTVVASGAHRLPGTGGRNPR